MDFSRINKFGIETIGSLAHILLFLGTLVAGGLIFIFSPVESISTDEKRELARFPSWNWQAVARGDFTRLVDEYVSDNFILRYSLTEVSGYLRSFRGIAHDGIEIFSVSTKVVSKSNKVTEVATPKSETQSDVAISNSEMISRPYVEGKTINGDMQRSDQVFQTPQNTKIEASPSMAEALVRGATSPLSLPDGPAPESEPYQTIESIIIYHGRAVQMVGAPNSALQALSKVINGYKQELGSSVRVYFMPIPIGSDFYLPQRLKRGDETEQRLIHHMFSLLDQDVIKVRAYEKLAERKAEYIYFNTDHHWTGLGAYYAYQAFAEAAGLSALPLTSFTYGRIQNFLGTLYHRTLSPALRKTGDTVEYYKVPFSTKVTYFQNGRSDGTQGVLYAEFARDGMAYGVFLGGDYPLTRITSSVANKRKIIVIKDSYGNAFVPYLTSHYEEVFVVDYRYYNGSIRALMNKHGVEEILFAHNTYVMVAPYTAHRARGFFKLSSDHPL